MKTTNEFREIARWVSPLEAVRETAKLETLAVARFETVTFESAGLALVDLVFDDGARTAVMSSIAVSPTILTQRIGAALMWPEHLAEALPADLLRALEDAVTPWLRTLVRGRVAAGESIRRYAPSAAFDAARERGDLGAAPLAIALPAVAPFVYARRFAHGRSVELRCAHAARGAAVLRDLARTLAADAVDDASARWFGVRRAAVDGTADLAIVDDLADAPGARSVVVTAIAAPAPAPWRSIAIPQPVPVDVNFSFDEADAPAVGWFAARSIDPVERPPRSAQRAPGNRESAGRIALWVRADARVASDADTDEAAELALRLGAIGITTLMCTTAAEVAAFAPDLVHVFAGYDEDDWRSAAAQLRSIGAPYVVSFAPLAGYTQWEEAALSFLMNTVDAEMRASYRAAYDLRKLALPDGSPKLEQPPALAAAADQSARELLAGAAAVFSSDDPEMLRARFGLSPQRAILFPGTLIAPEAEEDDCAALVPSEPFALVHAPLLTRHHQDSLVDALRGNVPVVFAGPVSDVQFSARLQRCAPGGMLIVADPTPGTLAALYRRAALYVDAALRPTGAARIVRAALCGALPILPARSPLARQVVPEAATYEPLSIADTLRAFRQAMGDGRRNVRAAQLAQRLSTIADQELTFRTYLQAYAATADVAQA